MFKRIGNTFSQAHRLQFLGFRSPSFVQPLGETEPLERSDKGAVEPRGWGLFIRVGSLVFQADFFRAARAGASGRLDPVPGA